MNKRGFLVASILPYLVAGIAILGVLGGTYYKGRLAGVEATEARLTPLLTACEGRVKALGDQIDAQNAAVEALQAAGKARVAKAEKGVKAAQEGAKAARSEAERLRVAASSKSSPSACPAKDAVDEVRKGLK